MQVKEISRTKNKFGQTIVEYETGKQKIRLIKSYDTEKSLEDLLYVLACQKLSTHDKQKVTLQ